MNNSDESNNTFLGARSDLGTSGITNATAVGFKAQVDQNNSLVLGSIAGVNLANTSTKVGIGTTAPKAPLHVVRDDGSAHLRITETASTAAKRFQMRLENTGPAGFTVRNTDAAEGWEFAMNANDDFVVSRGGTGGAEMLVGKDGDFHVGRPFKLHFDTGGNLDIAGTLTEGSDRAAKQDIRPRGRGSATAAGPGTRSSPTSTTTCYAFGLFRQAREANDPEVCAPVRHAFPRAWDVCSYFGRRPERGRTFPGAIPSLQEGNIFLVRDGDGFADRAEGAGIRNGGWTWNAKFADLDNDGWQDLYVANGWPGLPVRESNILYRNLRGQGFADETVGAGMEDYLDTYAYSYIDHDDDGDLDVLALPANAPPVLWRNDTVSGSIEVELLDRTHPNRRAVGATVAIEYGDGETQLREVKAGGGYLSFDAPTVHFGLGDARSVETIVVLWPDGEVTELEGPFDADARYRLVRQEGGAE